MTPRQQIISILLAILVFIIILEMVRRRKLKEEYTWLWLLTGVAVVIIAVWYDLLLKITHFIGAVAPTSTVFIFALIFLLLVCLQFSVSISKLNDQVKNLAQEVTLLRAEKEKRKKD
jgi:hypothetical protein